MRTEIVSSAGTPPGGQVANSQPAGQRPEPEPYIDKHECARRLGRTVRSVDTYMLKGIIPFYKLGRTVAFKWSEVDAHIKSHFRVCLRG
jgi:predicted DNA-binding transcriptional regulator AlpA